MTTATASARRRRRPGLSVGLPRLTVRGWAVLAGAAVAVIVAVAVGWRDLLYAGLVLAVLIGVSGIAVRVRASSLTATRRIVPDVVPLGGTVTVQAVVGNTAWLRAGPQLWRDLVPRGFSAPGFQVLPSLGARGAPDSRTVLAYPLEARERGMAELGPLVVQQSDPFGLTFQERLVGGTDLLTVLPRIVPLERRAPRRTSIADSSAPAWKSGHGHDDVIARDYRPGDALRHVHWRASAHRGELMVRQEQSQDESRALLVLDTRRDSYPSAAAFEWAVSYAASLLVHLTDSSVGAALLETAPVEGAAEVERDPREALLDLAVARRRPLRGADYLPRVRAALAADPAPLYAVLGAVPDPELAQLTAARSRTAGAALILVGDPARRMPEGIASAGWRFAAVGPDGDAAAVWQHTAIRGRP